MEYRSVGDGEHEASSVWYTETVLVGDLDGEGTIVATLSVSSASVGSSLLSPEDSGLREDTTSSRSARCFLSDSNTLVLTDVDDGGAVEDEVNAEDATGRLSFEVFESVHRGKRPLDRLCRITSVW